MLNAKGIVALAHLSMAIRVLPPLVKNS